MFVLTKLVQEDEPTRSIPEASGSQVTVGFPTVTDGTAILRLKPWEERSRKQQAITQQLQPLFSSLPGVRAFPTNPPSLGQSARSKPVEFIIMSQASYAELARLTEVFLTELRKYPGLLNLDTDLRLNTPELRVRVDRDKMADVGANVDTVGRTLESMLGGRQVTRYKDEGEQYDVIDHDRRPVAARAAAQVPGGLPPRLHLPHPGRPPGGHLPAPDGRAAAHQHRDGRRPRRAAALRRPCRARRALCAHG